MQDAILLGVDGGNTKTDFFLFNCLGTRLAHLRTGTCSHEALPGSYREAEQLLDERINQVCGKAGITRQNISRAVFGLAGADTHEQHVKLLAITERLLPGKTLVCNDSMLGVMAAAPGGIGVCSINGTGASVCGVNEQGQTLQVGGIGHVSSDFAGGRFAAMEVLRCVYSARYRDGDPTALTKEVLELLDAEETADLMELFHYDNLKLDDELTYRLNRLLFRCAREGDEVSQSVLHTMARTLAQSTAGCIKYLGFRESTTVVLAGSLWTKGDYPDMLQVFQEEVRQRVNCSCNFTVLEEPPALGAVLEAYRRVAGEPLTEELRERFAAGVRG